MSCNDCEQHKLSAAMWRNEAYKHAGTPLPWEPEELLRKEYERGFIDGMQKQMQSSVDKAVNVMSRTWVGLTDEQKDILNFLFGLRAIDDVWFGDKHPTERGQYWWRNRLRKAFQEAAHGIKEKNT